MSLFSKPKVVLWPKKDSLEVFVGQKENNFFTFSLNLWEDLSTTQLLPLADFFKDYTSSQIYTCISDDITVTKSFIYDTKAESVDKKEIKALAENSITFTIDPEYIDFQLDQSLPEKTIIRAKISNSEKIKILQQNLAKISLQVTQYETVSQLITRVVSSFYQNDYFLIYQPSQSESYLILAKGEVVFLTSRLKGASPDLQKIINYSPIYFQKTTTKLFVPQGSNFETKSTTLMDTTFYQSSQIASSLNQPSNLPLPVLGFYLANSNTTPTTAIIKSDNPVTKPMETKKNILPIVLVFIITAVIASLVLWMITRRSSELPIETPMSDQISITPTIEELPTSTPIPTLAEVSKKLKIQVLNATEINGQAAKVKSELTALGFTSVTVGNSSEKATKNEIRLQVDSNSAASYFQQKLSSFSNATISELSETSTYDVVVVIGEDLGTATIIKPTVSEELTVSPVVTKAKATATPTKKPTLTLTPTPTE